MARNVPRGAIARNPGALNVAGAQIDATKTRSATAMYTGM
jgi:hypothetical protein